MNMCRMRLMFAFLCMSELAADCPYKECDCSGNTISCEDRGLKSIPTIISNSTTGLNNLILALNSITSIPGNSLPYNLAWLSLASNPITFIDDTAFDGSATTLKSLTFTNALLTRIPNALLHVHSLKSLSILETSIQDWNNDVMKFIGLTVTSLCLDNVGLKAWPGWVSYFSHLTELTISDSSISVIPDGAFDLVASSLTSLNLDTNKLSTVPKALSSLTSLQTLSMEENTIADIAWLPSASKLMSLTLTSNTISDAKQLSIALQPYAGSLNDLGCENNLLTQIPDVYFLANIGSVDFSHNRISDINSGSLPPALSNIDLGYNLLPSIPSVMSKLQSITDLDLTYNAITQLRGVDYPSSATDTDFSHNFITELTAASFPEQSVIVTLTLNNNPITQISTDAFNNLYQLTELYLSNTKLSRLPLALSSLTNLRIFDVTNNAHLVCTCIEKDVGPWAKKFYPGDLRGDCGLVSVYTFLVTLSPSCPSERYISVD